MRILVVEDEAAVAQHIKLQLQKVGFDIDVSDNGFEACRMGEDAEYSAVILDLGLPGLDGLSVLRRWRQNGRAMPVIVVTSRGAWTDRVGGIDAGADDYLIKPFVFEELLARLRAVLRRSTDSLENAISVGPFDINLRRRQVIQQGHPVTLTPLEYRLLVFFCRQPNTVMSSTVILEHLHGIAVSKDVNSLERLVARLRKKIGAHVIETRRGHGYMLSVDK